MVCDRVFYFYIISKVHIYLVKMVWVVKLKAIINMRVFVCSEYIEKYF